MGQMIVDYNFISFWLAISREEILFGLYLLHSRALFLSCSVKLLKKECEQNFHVLFVHTDVFSI